MELTEKEIEDIAIKFDNPIDFYYHWKETKFCSKSDYNKIVNAIVRIVFEY